MGSRTHDLAAELRMHSLTLDCDTLSNEEIVVVVVPVTIAEAELIGYKERSLYCACHSLVIQ